MQLSQFYNQALVAPKGAELVVTRSPTGGHVDELEVRKKATSLCRTFESTENIHARQALATALETEIKTGSPGLKETLEDLLCNDNRAKPLTPALVDKCRLKFRNSAGFNAVSGVAVEQDNYFSLEARYARSYHEMAARHIPPKSSDSGRGDKVLRWKGWLKRNRARTVQYKLIQTEAKACKPVGRNGADKKYRKSIKSYEKIWKSLCEGKRSGSTRKQERNPLYRDGVLVGNGQLRNLAVRVLSRKLADESRLAATLSGTPIPLGGQLPPKRHKELAVLKQQIESDYAQLKSLINECKYEPGTDPSSAISLETLDLAATAFDLTDAAVPVHTPSSKEDAAKNDREFLTLLANLQKAAENQDQQPHRKVRDLQDIGQLGPRGRVRSTKMDNISLRQQLRDTCKLSGYFDQRLFSQFWINRRKEFLGKDSSSVSAQQIKEFVDEFSKESAAAGKLLGLRGIDQKVIMPANVIEHMETEKAHSSIPDEPLMQQLDGIRAHYQNKAEEEDEGNNGFLTDTKSGNGGYRMKTMGREVGIGLGDFAAIKTRITNQYIAEHGIVALAGQDGNEKLYNESDALGICLEHLQEKHANNCESTMKQLVNDDTFLICCLDTGSFKYKQAVGEMLAISGQNNLNFRQLLRDRVMNAFQAAYKESEDPLSEFAFPSARRDTERQIIEKLQRHLAAPDIGDDKTVIDARICAYNALIRPEGIDDVDIQIMRNSVEEMQGYCGVLANEARTPGERMEALSRITNLCDRVLESKKALAEKESRIPPPPPPMPIQTPGIGRANGRDSPEIQVAPVQSDESKTGHEPVVGAAKPGTTAAVISPEDLEFRIMSTFSDLSQIIYSKGIFGEDLAVGGDRLLAERSEIVPVDQLEETGGSSANEQFLKNVAVARAVSSGRDRAIRLQGEVAEKRKHVHLEPAAGDGNDKYQIYDRNGGEVDTEIIDKVARDVAIGRILSDTRDAPPQLVRAFINPPDVTGHMDLVPRDLANRVDELAGFYNA